MDKIISVLYNLQCMNCVNDYINDTNEYIDWEDIDISVTNNGCIHFSKNKFMILHALKKRNYIHRNYIKFIVKNRCLLNFAMIDGTNIYLIKPPFNNRSLTKFKNLENGKYKIMIIK